MPDDKTVLTGTTLPVESRTDSVASRGISAADALSALKQLISVSREVIEIHEIESTKRERLRTYRATEVERIKASERVLRDYFDRIFAERREQNQVLFDGLRQAREAGDVAAMQTFVGGIVEVARISPLAQIGDLADLRRAMDDPDTVFQL
ncbi:hypothetical protein [Micromonospora craniellae]|uniref:hypothetical protein n=1 Tax=Micromonospora craniellae TaxID=2294034 RepID=UPI0018F16B43|nr:hypothetical protein [Micromonospora craniellae]